MKRNGESLSSSPLEPIPFELIPGQAPVEAPPIPLGTERDFMWLLETPAPPKRSYEDKDGNIQWLEDTQSEQYVYDLLRHRVLRGAYGVFRRLQHIDEFEFDNTPPSFDVGPIPPTRKTPPTKETKTNGTKWLTALSEELIASGVPEELLISVGDSIRQTAVDAAPFFKSREEQ